MRSDDSSEDSPKSPSKKQGRQHWFGLGRLFRRGIETEEDFHRLIDEGEEEGIIEEEEHELIHSVFTFMDTIVREVMVPRVEIAACPINAPLSDVLNIIITKGHSRVPVYDQKMDNIIGIVYAKDLLKFFDSDKNHPKIREIMRPPFFVPETKKIIDLLKEFQLQKMHMAIVVDEYGGTAGLVTLEDIIEEIVGEIQDEYDSDKPLIKKISEHEFIVDGSMDLEELNEEIHIDLPTEEGVETLAGFLFGLFGSVPKEKDKKSYNGFEFVIEKVIRRRISQVRIIKK